MKTRKAITVLLGALMAFAPVIPVMAEETAEEPEIRTAETEPEVSKFTYVMTNYLAISSADLLNSETAEFINPDTGKTETAYNGYLRKTSGATYEDAVGFIEQMNEHTTSGNGTWKLLSSEGEAQAWRRTIGIKDASAARPVYAEDFEDMVDYITELGKAGYEVIEENMVIGAEYNVEALYGESNASCFILSDCRWFGWFSDIPRIGPTGFNVIWVPAE